MAWKPKQKEKTVEPTKKAIKSKAVKGKPKDPKAKPLFRGLPNPDKPEKRADEFPNISTFEREDMDDAKRLMLEDLENQDIEKAIKSARAATKEQLAVIARKYGVEGMRWGQMVVYFGDMKTKWTLISDLLLKELASAGVDTEILDQCREAAMQESKPFLDVKVKDITPKPKEEEQTEG